MAQKRKGGVSAEAFDAFLAEQGMLEANEDHAVKERIAEQIAAAMEEQGCDQSRNGRADENQPASSTGSMIRQFRLPRSTRCAAPQTRYAARSASTWCDASVQLLKSWELRPLDRQRPRRLAGQHDSHPVDVHPRRQAVASAMSPPRAPPAHGRAGQGLDASSPDARAP